VPAAPALAAAALAAPFRGNLGGRAGPAPESVHTCWR